MENETCSEINREKVIRRIDNFIKNDGQSNVYVKAPSLEIIARTIYAHEVTDKEVASAIDLQLSATSAVGSALFSFSSKPSTYPTLMSAIEINKVCSRAQYQKFLCSLKAIEVLSLATAWNVARQREHPPKGIEKLFSWIPGSIESFYKSFLKGKQRAYEWLQEERPLEQCDIKNGYAIIGFNLINRYNKNPINTQKAPIDEFVAEQIVENII